MHRRFPILVTLALLSAALPAQTPHTIRIEPLRNEKWWGLFAGGGPAQPFAAPFDSSDCDSCGTFAIPFMISSGGRMMWSSAPADVVFDGSLFTVTPSGTQPTVAKGGRTLREAYLYCVHKYAWPKGTAPARPFTTQGCRKPSSPQAVPPCSPQPIPLPPTATRPACCSSRTAGRTTPERGASTAISMPLSAIRRMNLPGADST